VILGLAIMAILAALVLRTGGDEHLSNRALRESTVSLYTAEAGLRATLGNWPTAAALALGAGDSLDLGWITQPNRTKYRVVIHRMDNGGNRTYVLFSRGRGIGLLGGQSTITAVVGPGAPLFTRGLYTEGGITISSSGGSDGYDSEEGAYSAATADSTGSMATNGAISMSGSAVVKGDAEARLTNTGGTVTGTRTSLAAAFPTPANLACPAGGYTASVPAGAGVTYSAITGVLKVSGGNNLTLPVPPAQYYFSQVILSGGSTLTMNNGGAHADIIVSDKVDLSGGGIINTAAKPTELSLNACGSPVTPSTWTLSGGSGAYFSVYAPNHPITISGSGDLYGAMIGASLNSSGGSKLHYDESLGRVGNPNALSVLAGSWAQVP
jgi:hypothetical protein